MTSNDDNESIKSILQTPCTYEINSFVFENNARYLNTVLVKPLLAFRALCHWGDQIIFFFVWHATQAEEFNSFRYCNPFCYNSTRPFSQGE